MRAFVLLETAVVNDRFDWWLKQDAGDPAEKRSRELAGEQGYVGFYWDDGQVT